MSARDDPRAYSEILDTLMPGGALHRRVEVSNPAGAAQDVALSCTAADISSGHFLGGPEGDRNDLCDWTTLGPSRLTLAAGARALVTVSIAVPPGAAPGERYGVVWASVRQADPGGLTRVTRVGVRLYVYVGGHNPPATDFTVTGLQMTRPDGVPVLTARIDNTGGRAVDLSGELRLTGGPGSLAAGPFPIDGGVTLGPGRSGEVRAPTSAAVPAGSWTATLTVRSGTVTRSATAVVVVPSAPGGLVGPSASSPARPPVREASGSPSPPGHSVWWVGLWLLVLAGIGAVAAVVVAAVGRTRAGSRRNA